MLLAMKQASTYATAHDGRDRGRRSFTDHLATMSLSDPRVAVFLAMPTTARIDALIAILESAGGENFRQEASRWIVQALAVERLVPQQYAEWRPVVREAMLYFGSHLSTSRLAPKIVEQVELPVDTTPENRLLRLIAKVPALQKLGQVIARNRHLNRSVRRELTQLENGICDVTAEEIRTIIVQNLGPSLERSAVEIDTKIFCEASVSAVVRFTWYNPERRQREHGVFKVMKPYVAAYFAEEMDLLARLAAHLGSKHDEYGFAEHVLSETFDDVRRLLQHEVEFAREQASLQKASRLYSSVKSIHIPHVIRPLCTSTITAMTEEYGEKITKAVAGMPKRRRGRIAERLMDAVVAVPLLTPTTNGMFHADPHAGNLLYNKRTGILTLLDWALTGHITEEQRQQFAMLFLMVLLRDSQGVCTVIEALSMGGENRRPQRAQVIREQVKQFFNEQPLARIPRAVDIVDLLERTAWQGVRLPNHLVMLRKVLFTLDGILHDIAGPSGSMETIMMQRLVQTWLENPIYVGWPLSLRDWVSVYWSVMLYPTRLAVGGLQQLSAFGRSSAETS
jgi:ubiquinone biosynthesis protein